MLLGGATAVGSVAVHAWWWGLPLAVATPAATLVALPGGWWRRLPFALAWSAVVVWASVERPEGDVVVRADAAGYVLLAMTVAVVVGGVVGLVDRSRSHAGTRDSDKVGATS